MSDYLPIPFCLPALGEEEKQAVCKVLDSGWLTRGAVCEEFEQTFARTVGAKHAVSLSSCTAALHLALLAYDIGPGDEVITTPLTFPATVNAILYTGATPVFVDVRDDYNWRPEQVLRAITEKTKAVIGVDMHGLPCWKPKLPAGVKFIQDAAHSLGASSAQGIVGSYADATCFSFYSTKQITTGDGGMLTTNDPEVAERVRRLSLHGMDGQAWKRYRPDGSPTWDIPELGYKYNMTDVQAAIGLAQLYKLGSFLEKRRQIACWYDQALAPLTDRIALPFARYCYHLYAIRVCERNRVLEGLKERGVGVGIHFPAITDLTYYKERFPDARTPNATEIGRTTLSLPLYPGMTEEHIHSVVARLTEVLDAI